MPQLTITSLTVHRFIITAITVSSKALCDVFCTASYYAKVGGLSLSELNLLEREFLKILDWSLTCTKNDLQIYYQNLVESSGHYDFNDDDYDSDNINNNEINILKAKTKERQRSVQSDQNFLLNLSNNHLKSNLSHVLIQSNDQPILNKSSSNNNNSIPLSRSYSDDHHQLSSSSSSINDDSNNANRRLSNSRRRVE